MENLYLIAGLGNPGREYAGTRHNIGFMLVERLAAQWKADWVVEKKFNARLARVERDGRKIILCQPQTFMNDSGEAVAALARFYQLPVPQILIVVDDADLALGQIRLKPEGSSGGHHGLDSIEQQLATRIFSRQRLGIGRREGDGRKITNYVLGNFGKDEQDSLQMILARAGQQVDCWLHEGLAAAMNKFNGVIKTP